MYAPVAIVESNGLLIAINIDEAEEMIRVDRGSLLPLGESHSANNCAEALLTMDGREIVVLSCDLLLLAKERECLRELQSAEQKRLLDLATAAG